MISPFSCSSQTVERPNRTASSLCRKLSGESAGINTSPSSVPLKAGPVRSSAGAHSRSRNRFGGLDARLAELRGEPADVIRLPAEENGIRIGGLDRLELHVDVAVARLE